MKPVANNFRAVAGAPVSTVPIAQLVAMIDCEQEAGRNFAVVSKYVGPDHVTTIYDIHGKRFFRSAHVTGMRSFWKGVAKRRPNVRLLHQYEAFQPA